MHCYKSYHQTSIFNFKLVTDCSYFCMNLTEILKKCDIVLKILEFILTSCKKVFVDFIDNYDLNVKTHLKGKVDLINIPFKFSLF